MAPFAVALLAGGLRPVLGRGRPAPTALARAAGWLRVLVFAGALLAFEWLRGHMLTGFPWDLPGESWRAGSPLSQAASLVGAYGLSWLTMAVARAGPAARRPPARRRSPPAPCAARGARRPLGYRPGAAGRPPARSADAPMVRIVQPDLPRGGQLHAPRLRPIRPRLPRPDRPAGRAPRPTSSSGRSAPSPRRFDDYLAPGDLDARRDRRRAAARPDAAHRRLSHRAGPAGDYAPGGLAISTACWRCARRRRAWRRPAVYDKHRLVPFGEYLPLARCLAPLRPEGAGPRRRRLQPGPPPAPMPLAAARRRCSR